MGTLLPFTLVMSRPSQIKFNMKLQKYIVSEVLHEMNQAKTHTKEWRN